MKIATWNVNSLRVRLTHVLDWLKSEQPDVLALQEIKVMDEDFPFMELLAAGYNAVCAGQKAYNGVAILSRDKATDIVTNIPDYHDPQRRLLAATINGVRIINLYVPNGQDTLSEKYQYKLEWLKKLDGFLQKELQTHPQVVVLGDFNIAPADIDVHDPKHWEGKVLFTESEKQAFKSMLDIGFKDCFRQLDSTQSFTWWDYRLNAYKRNLGVRIDHILASDQFASRCVSCVIFKSPREWDRPSDHVPVMAKFNIDQVHSS